MPKLTFRKKAITAIVAMGTLGLVTSPASAQGLDHLSIEDLFDVKVMELASGVEQKVNKAPAVVSVISAEEIKAVGATSLHEALEMVPGLHVIPSSLADMKPVITFRGIYTDKNPQVLLFVDGQRVSYSIEGGILPNFSLPLANVKRIEVIRGPASALYGSEAYAGVINLITYGKEDGNELAVSIGELAHKGLSFRNNIKINQGWGLNLSGEYYSRNADTSRIVEADAQTIFDALFGSNASLAPTHLNDAIRQTSLNLKLYSEHWQISSRLMDMDSPTMAGVANAITRDAAIKHDVRSLSISYDSKDWLTNWHINPVFSHINAESDFLYKIFPDGSILPIGNDGNVNFADPAGIVTFTDGLLGYPSTQYQVNEMELPFSYFGALNHKARFSLGYRKEQATMSESKNFGPGVINGTEGIVGAARLTDVTGTEFIFLPDSSREVFFVSAQDIWKVSDHVELTVGLRYDDYSDVGSTLTPRATLVWENSDKLTTKLLYGSAFRAPSFQEKFVTNNPAGLGNADLDNETLDSFELSFSYIINSKAWVNLNTYRYKAESLIQFVPDANQTTSTTQNINQLDGEGVEMELFWQPRQNLKLNVNGAWQSTRNNFAGQEQPFVPRQMLFAKLNWQLSPQWQLNLSSKGIFNREREAGDTRQPVKNYWLTKLNIQYTRQNWTASLSIKNLFDEDIREPASLNSGIINDFPMNQRQSIVELSYQF